MKGDIQVVTYLNQALANELIAINQYFLHSKMFKNWGFHKLAEKLLHESIDEMKHADKLTDRILFLEGLPNLQNLGKLMIGEHTEEMLSCDLKLEMKAIPELKEAIDYCESVRDFTSAELLEEILEAEEEHVDWIETQLDIIKKIGIQNYLQSQL